MKPCYLAIDTESGGLHEGASLLTVYMAVLDSDMNLIDELYLKVKSPDGIYDVTDEALDLTGINIQEHHSNASPKEEAAARIKDFLLGYTVLGTNKLTVLGHDVHNDVDNICKLLNSKELWYTYTHRIVLDTLYVAAFLNKSGRIKTSGGFSLKAIAYCLDVDFIGVQHDARSDALTTAAVMKEMMRYA